MALPSAFQERFQKMEETRNQRLSLLQGEKELQTKKSHLLSAKFSNIRIMEQRCLLLEHTIAGLNFKILAHKSEIENLETKYNNSTQQFRVLKSEVEEIEESEKEKDQYYETKVLEMKGFKERVERLGLELQEHVMEMRKSIAQLKSSLQEIQGNKEYMNNSDIAKAEAQKAQLLSFKHNLKRRLASNYQLRAQLQKQLYNILKSQDQERMIRSLMRMPWFGAICDFNSPIVVISPCMTRDLRTLPESMKLRMSSIIVDKAPRRKKRCGDGVLAFETLRRMLVSLVT